MRMLYIILFNIVCANYSVVESESKVEYFGSHPTHGFSGKSSSILLISDCSNNDICSITFKVPIISINSKNDNRDSNMLNYLKAFSFPYVELSFSDFLVKEYRDDLVACQITIAGVSQLIDIPLRLSKKTKNQYKVESSFSISLNQFGIELPKLLFIPIDSDIKINVNLLINRLGLNK